MTGSRLMSFIPQVVQTGEGRGQPTFRWYRLWKEGWWVTARLFPRCVNLTQMHPSYITSLVSCLSSCGAPDKGNKQEESLHKLDLGNYSNLIDFFFPNFKALFAIHRKKKSVYSQPHSDTRVCFPTTTQSKAGQVFLNHRNSCS